MTKAYILGALHDGTSRRLTFRIVQKDRGYIEFLLKGIHDLGRNAWMYQEGKTRHLYVVEFSKSLLKNYKIITNKDKIEYIRGYFDAEGGISKNPKVRYYIYFAQKDHKDLEQVRTFLEKLNIRCGEMHNPSRKVDPDYWRFFIHRNSYEKFAKIIGSWHPIKSQFLRMKI